MVLDKKIDKKYSISGVAKQIGVPTHVIRFWETKFPKQIKPRLGNGKRRYYFDHDIKIIKRIKTMLHDEGYTIAGLQNHLKKRKINPEIEQNLQFLKDSELKNIDTKSTSELNFLITRIESNLNNLEKLLS